MDDDPNIEAEENVLEEDEVITSHHEQHLAHVGKLYDDYFLNYASYVILERAVPYLTDGLKPVQRRVLYTMHKHGDGRYTKVANLVGATMALHPHGDSSIYGALVALAQKDMLIDKQGNFGNVHTGDGASAARYIEARLTPLGRDILFNDKITDWQDSYDGRNKEPVSLPVKFPLLLAQGVEGIAVGLASKILPHNFNDLVDASIACLKGEEFELYPDFPTGGIADCSNYKDGLRGGKIRVRAQIEAEGKRKLRISDLPYGVTTEALKNSIESAIEKNKIKASKIEDFTAKDVNLLVHLPSGLETDTAIKALYAFTNCEVSISTNCCVIDNETPVFIGVSEILRKSTAHTVGLHKRELEVILSELEARWHAASLEQIFIENKIYRRIEKEETWEGVLKTVEKGLKPHIKHLKFPVVKEDIERLVEIPIKRISKYNSAKADNYIKELEERIKETQHHLAHLTEFTIAWFEKLKKKYGKDFPRKTRRTIFDRVVASKVIIASETLYYNKKDGFIGFGRQMKKEGEEMCKCSPLDDLIIFRRDGNMVVSRVQEKLFIGKNIVHVDLLNKENNIVYSLIYKDGKSKVNYAKKFKVGGITRDRDYEVFSTAKGSRLLYFKAHEGENKDEKVTARLKPGQGARKQDTDFDFGELDIKGRGSKGNIVSKYEIASIVKFKDTPDPQSSLF